MAFQVLNAVVNLAITVSGVAVGIKRLHDRDRSAWWLMGFYFVPFVLAFVAIAVGWAGSKSVGMTAEWASLVFRLCILGAIALVFWGFVEIGCLGGSAGYNRFGPDPLGRQRPKPQI